MIKKCKIHGDCKHTKDKNGRIRCNKCAVDAVNKRRRKVKRMGVAYMGDKCHVCDYDKSINALEFHHIDPTEKDFNVGYKGHSLSWERVKFELNKCVMLCANCHREVHAGITVLNLDNIERGYEEIKIIKSSNCIDCGVDIDIDAKRCVKCSGIQQRKVLRPNYESLINEVKCNGYSATGRKYNVSDNSIRKWIKSYEKET